MSEEAELECPDCGRGLSLEAGRDICRQLQAHEPATPEPLTEEDRARLEGLLQVIRDDVPHDPQGQANADALTRALALIDQQAKALEAADELALVSGRSPIRQGRDGPIIDYRHWTSEIEAARAAYRSTRTTTEGGGTRVGEANYISSLPEDSFMRRALEPAQAKELPIASCILCGRNFRTAELRVYCDDCNEGKSE